MKKRTPKRSKSGDDAKGLEGLADKLIRRIPLPWLIALSAIAAILVLLLVLAPPAHARECARWGIVTVHREWPQYSYRERQCLRWARHETRVYAYERRDNRWNDDDDNRSGRKCREVRKAVGDQHLTVEGAKKAANDNWAGTIRFHLGEKWMDLNNARHIEYECSRSSIKEGGVTTLGQTLSRCEITAQPCAPLRDQEAQR